MLIWKHSLPRLRLSLKRTVKLSILSSKRCPTPLLLSLNHQINSILKSKLLPNPLPRMLMLMRRSRKSPRRHWLQLPTEPPWERLLLPFKLLLKRRKGWQDRFARKERRIWWRYWSSNQGRRRKHGSRRRSHRWTRRRRIRCWILQVHQQILLLQGRWSQGRWWCWQDSVQEGGQEQELSQETRQGVPYAILQSRWGGILKTSQLNEMK